MEPLALAICVRFVPLCGHPDCSPDCCMPCIPGGRFSAVPLQPGGGLVLSLPAAGTGCRIGPRHPIKAPRRRRPGARRPSPDRRLARAVAWPATLRVVWMLHERRCHVAGGRSRRPSQGQGLAELVMYLSSTGDVLVVDPPYTCAGNAPDHQAARSDRGGGERGARTAD